MNLSLPSNTVPLWAAANDRDSWQESELCHRELLRKLPVAVYTCDVAGRVTFFNRAAAELWGRQPELYKDTWCGAWKLRSIDGSRMELSDCPMARTLREGRAIHGQEMIVEREDGTWRKVLVHPEPVFNSEGRLVGAVNTLVDTSPEKPHEIFAHPERPNGVA